MGSSLGDQGGNRDTHEATVLVHVGVNGGLNQGDNSEDGEILVV